MSVKMKASGATMIHVYRLRETFLLSIRVNIEGPSSRHLKVGNIIPFSLVVVVPLMIEAIVVPFRVRIDGRLLGFNRPSSPVHSIGTHNPLVPAVLLTILVHFSHNFNPDANVIITWKQLLYYITYKFRTE